MKGQIDCHPQGWMQSLRLQQFPLLRSSTLASVAQARREITSWYVGWWKTLLRRKQDRSGTPGSMTSLLVFFRVVSSPAICFSRLNGNYLVRREDALTPATDQNQVQCTQQHCILPMTSHDDSCMLPFCEVGK